MNPYESYQAIRDGIQTLLHHVRLLKSSYNYRTHPPDASSILEDLQARLTELQREHLRLWRLQKRADYHLEFIVSKLESMDTLCGQLAPHLEYYKKSTTTASSKIFGCSSYSSLHGFGGCPCSQYPNPSQEEEETMHSVEAVDQQLKQWLESQSTASADILACQTLGVSPRLKMLTRVGYEPLTELSALVQDLLQNGQPKVVMIHGLPGIGKSSLAEYVASHPSQRFSSGTVKLQLGQACKITADCNNSTDHEYENLLALKLKTLLCDLKYEGEYDEIKYKGASLQVIWCMLVDFLRGSSYLIVLDDVWERDIVDRFSRVLDNDCRYLVTCSTELIHGAVAAANFVEVRLQDVCQVSKAILRFHSGLCVKQNFPSAAKKLLHFSSHHPLALAIQAEALRGVKVKEWNMAIAPLLQHKFFVLPKQRNLGRNKLQLPNIMSSSIEFSVRSMETETKDLFNALAALSWLQPLPVTCLQALWVGLERNGPFMLQIRQLVRRCLLQRTPDFSYVSLHQTVSLYLETKELVAVQRLLTSSSPEIHALVAPWLYFFGKDKAKGFALTAFLEVLRMPEGNLQVKILLTTADVLKSSETLQDRELANFNKHIGPEIVDLLSKASNPSTHASIARYLAVGFNSSAFQSFAPDLISAGLIPKIIPLLSSKLDLRILVKNEVADVLAKMARTKSDYVIDELLNQNVLKQLVLVLEPKSEWIHESALDAIISLFGGPGGDIATEQVLEAGLFESILFFLEDRRDFKKYRALKILQHLLNTGQEIVVDKILGSKLIENMETLLQCSSEGLQIAAANFYKQIIERGGDRCIEKIFQTQAVERLYMMLQSSSRAVQLAVFDVLMKLLEAKRSCAQRVFKEGTLAHLQEILREKLEDQTSEHARNLYI